MPPFPTWIDPRVEPAPGNEGRPLLHFARYGFPADPDWEEEAKEAEMVAGIITMSGGH